MKNLKKILALCLSILICVSAIPLSVFAAPAADLPDNMIDSPILRALEYTGYDVQAQKDDGTLYQSGSYSTNTPAAVRSNIHYGTSLSGKETVADSTTVTGLAPNIAKFEQYGLCCAGFVTYYVCNYLPNIEGADTQFITDAINATGWNSQAVVTWQKALDNLISAGQIEKIGTSPTNVDRTKLAPGDLIIFGNEEDATTHIAVYSGTYNGRDFMIHVGSDVGPEIMPVDWMSNSANGAKTSDPNGYYHVPENMIKSEGNIDVYKTSTDGAKLAGASFVATSTTNPSLQYYIGPTDSNGYASVSGVEYSTYTIKETVFPSNYREYGTSSWTVTLDKNTPNNTATINAINEIIPGSCKIIKVSEDNKVDGINFTITGNGVNKTVTTANGGQVTISDLKPGTYMVIEESIEHYIPVYSQNVTVVSGQTAIVNFSNSLKRGNLQVTKTSEDGFVEGMTFWLRGTSDSGIAVNEFATTDENGIARFENILIGEDYVLREYNAPMRYYEPAEQIVDIAWNETTEAKFHNVLKRWCVEIYKVDSDLYTKDRTLREAQGDATLKGAVYGVYKDGALVDTYTTDEDGFFKTKNYICGDGWTIREISPSQGYLLDKTVYEMDVQPEQQNVDVRHMYYKFQEKVIKGKIEIYKHFGDGNTTDFVIPEENAVFQVYLKSAGSYDNAKSTERSELVTNSYGYAITDDLPYGVYVVEQVSGKEGKELMPPFEVTINDNGRTYPFFINNATFEADIEIVKKDATTGKIIPTSGIGFKVRNTDTGEYIVQHINYPTPMDIDVYYTDTTGKLMLPYALPYGNYEIIEHNTCYGYILDSTPVSFTVDGTKDIVTVEKYNEPQMGIIQILKKGEVFSSVIENSGVYVPVYSECGLAGAEFNIYASEDIYTPDGTLRFAKGQQVHNMISNDEGIAESNLLYLGKYEIREVNSPYGTVLNGESIYVELTYAGELVSITHTESEFINERQKVIISLIKELEKDDKFSIGNAKEYVGVKFGLYAAESIVAVDGTEIPQDGLLEVIHIDESGNGIFTVDVPVGAKMYVKEISTDCHYVLSEEKFPVEFFYEGQDVGVVQLLVNNGQAIQNKIIRGSIEGIKTDEDNNPIENVVFGLFSADETVFTDETAILTATTDEDGYFIFENIPFGKWIIKELSCPKEYVLSDKLYDINISKDGELLSLAVTNEFVSGTVRVIKLSKEDNNKKLGGAIFELYIDTDNNGVFDPNVDKLVGTLTEKELGVYEYSNLRYGGYFVYESKAPDEYIKDDRYFYFKITEVGQTIVVENEKGVGFVNEPIPIPEPKPEAPKSPQTGDNSNVWSVLIVVLSSLVIITITSIKLRKYNKS